MTRPRLGARRGTASASGARKAVATRMIRGSPSTVRSLSTVPGSEASIRARWSSARSSRVAATTVRTRRSSSESAPSTCGAQQREEVLQLADPHGLEQDVLAAGEHAVDRRPGHPGLGGDVLDRDLGDAPLLAAATGWLRARGPRANRGPARRSRAGRGRCGSPCGETIGQVCCLSVNAAEVVTSAQAGAKRSRRVFLENLPTDVLGTSSMNSTRSGSCHLATFAGEEVDDLLRTTARRPPRARRTPAAARPTCRRRRR